MKNAAPLHPPLGARVAIVEFEDLECPDCARANPVIKEAVEKYHVPWVRHDFPLPFHTWSFEAAVDARWFDSKSDTKSKRLGSEFRDALFAKRSRPFIRRRTSRRLRRNLRPIASFRFPPLPIRRDVWRSW